MKIIKYVKENSLHAVFYLYGTSLKEIRYCIKQKEELIEVTNKMNTITLHYGKSVKTTSFEGEILDYAFIDRALENAVTSNEVIFKLYTWMKYLEKILEYISKMEKPFYEKTFSYFQKKYSHFLKTLRKLFRQNSRISLL